MWKCCKRGCSARTTRKRSSRSWPRCCMRTMPPAARCRRNWRRRMPMGWKHFTKRRPTGSPTGAWRATRSTTAASSTSTSWPRCASRSRRCSRRRTASRWSWPPRRPWTGCASTTRTGCSIRRSTSSACSEAMHIAPAWCCPRRTRTPARRGRCTSWPRRSPPRTRTCRSAGRCTAPPAIASPTWPTGCSSMAPHARAWTASGAASAARRRTSTNSRTTASAPSSAARSPRS